MKPRLIVQFAVATLCLALSGCGGKGGGGGSPSSALGSAVIQIKWPAKNRLIPSGTQAIVVSLSPPSGGTTTTPQTAFAPKGASLSTATLTFSGLKPVFDSGGNPLPYTFAAQAYALTTGTGSGEAAAGSVTASGNVNLYVTAGSESHVTLVMNSAASQAEFTFGGFDVKAQEGAGVTQSVPPGTAYSFAAFVESSSGAKLNLQGVTAAAAGSVTLLKSTLNTTTGEMDGTFTVDGASGQILIAYTDPNDPTTPKVTRTYTLNVSAQKPSVSAVQTNTLTYPVNDIDFSGAALQALVTGPQNDFIYDLSNDLVDTNADGRKFTGGKVPGRLSGNIVSLAPFPEFEYGILPAANGTSKWGLSTIQQPISDIRNVYNGKSYTHYILDSAAQKVFQWSGTGAVTAFASVPNTVTPTFALAVMNSVSTASPSKPTPFVYVASPTSISRLGDATVFPVYNVTDIATDSNNASSTFGAPRLLYVLDDSAKAVHVLAWDGTLVEDVALSATHTYRRIKVYGGNIYASFTTGTNAQAVVSGVDEVPK